MSNFTGQDKPNFRQLKLSQSQIDEKSTEFKKKSKDFIDIEIQGENDDESIEVGRLYDPSKSIEDQIQNISKEHTYEEVVDYGEEQPTH